MKAASPTMIEYFRSVASLNMNALDYGEYLNELYKNSLFTDQLGIMTFVIDAASGMYPFLGQGTEDVLGQRLDAMKEGGVDFTMSHFLIPDYFNRQMVLQQLDFFSTHTQFASSNMRFKVGFPTVDKRGITRFILQQHQITHRTENGFPLGYYGICTRIPYNGKETKIYQQIEILESGNWNIASYKEFYSEIDDDKLLTKREIEILKYIADGLSSIQIADKLCLSPHTINTHRKNMLRRTNSKNTADLLRYGILHKLV